MDLKKIVLAVAFILLAACAGGFVGYERAADTYYQTGYNAGYTAGYQDRNRLVAGEIADAVAANTKTETKIIYEKIPYTGNDVQVHTEKPVVTVEVNGKQQQIQQHTETADLAVKTETAVKIRIPERRWAFGIGTDGKKPAFMLKAPIKGAVGAWVAGSTNKKIMGGVSISF